MENTQLFTCVIRMRGFDKFISLPCICLLPQSSDFIAVSVFSVNRNVIRNMELRSCAFLPLLFGGKPEERKHFPGIQMLFVRSTGVE